MRVCSVLLVAAVALIAIGTAVEASATAQLVSANAVDEIQAAGVNTRFLRGYQTEEEQEDSDDNEKEDEVKSSNDDAVAALLPKSILAKANNGDLDMQAKLFKQWIKAKPEARQNAIATLMRNGGFDDYQTLLTAWRLNGERSTRGVGFHGSTKAVDDLLPRALIDKAALGNVQAQEKLFGKWIAAPSETRDTALKILLDSGKGKSVYTTLNNAWLNYLERLV